MYIFNVIFFVADVFAKYSSVGNVWVAQNPPGFGFVELTDVQDARDAVHSLDGTKIAGARYNQLLCYMYIAR